MTPHLGSEQLYAGIECGSTSDRDSHQGGINRMDIIEMNDLSVSLQDDMHQIGYCYKTDDHQEEEQVTIREG